MRDGEWLPGRELPLEKRYDTPVASKYIAEAHRRERSSGMSLLELQRSHLRQTLRSAHYATGTNSFIGADQHEFVRTVPAGGISDHEASEHVVAESFSGVELHHRDVLVRGRVEHVGRAICAE